MAGRGDLHFITFCCYRRRALLGTVQARNLAVQILGEVRARYGFALVGYVITPEHVHLLIGESRAVSPAKVVQVFKQRVSRRLREKECEEEPRSRLNEGEAELRRFWQRRYYDFNLYSRAKLKEKLEYIHANPVKEKLVEHPRDWPWSSWSFYETGEGLLKIDALQGKARQGKE